MKTRKFYIFEILYSQLFKKNPKAKYQVSYFQHVVDGTDNSTFSLKLNIRIFPGKKVICERQNIGSR